MTVEYVPNADQPPPLRRPRDNRRSGRRTPAKGLPQAAAAPAAPAQTAPPAPTGAAGAPSAAPGTGGVPLRRPTGTPPSGLTGPIRQLLGPMTGSLRLGRADKDVEQRLRVDWPQCKAHGLCAEIAPEVIHLDEWGYPLIDSASLSGPELATARKAVQVCPTLALRLTDPPR